ncbi:hypothetical protein SAMN05421812_104365 [Asanoa hainanensis]|uniref:Sporadically distributed protein, TIGR04141 family n=1 Tax=Asanoa hainanensis TaxID=560556 RepID=A0A239LIR4_9ACTN|nr:hypothetical protein [Asanoa hainanensis]SNT30351.1 hypothetical protein SAMN05421812_104365 [Asanoa hainanensis]
MDEVESVQPVALTLLRPFLSLTIVQIEAEDKPRAFDRFMAEVRRRSRRRRDDVRTIVADGIGEVLRKSPDLSWLCDDLYQVDAFILRHDKHPSWMASEVPYTNISYRLFLGLRRDRLIAFYTDFESIKESMQRWLDQPVRKQYQRIPEAFSKAAFLRGSQTRSIWLRGIHSKRSTKADTKALSGTRVEDLLVPGDGSFAMSAARADVPRDAGLVALRGTVGAAPDKSRMWSSGSEGVAHFFAQANEALVLVEEAMADQAAPDDPYPLLAQREENLSLVTSAFDVSFLQPEDLSVVGVSEERVSAAALLQQALIEVEGDPNCMDFRLHVGLDGSLGGTLKCLVREVRNRLVCKFGFDGDPTNLPSVRPILDALRDHGQDLMTAHYQSGHAFLNSQMWKMEIRSAAFPNWRFEDFSGYRVTAEKPLMDQDRVASTQDIHDAIGAEGDDSLFGWVVNAYTHGWLTCDDGAGEVSDFVHLDPAGKLTLIHVKGAGSMSPRRQIAVGPYEVVASQAVKNVRYISGEHLELRLARPSIARPACWTDGRRTTDRGELLEMLRYRGPQDIAHVAIVQPHVTHRSQQAARARAEVGTNTPDALRMMLLDSLLFAVRAAVVEQTGDLFVIGSR